MKRAELVEKKDLYGMKFEGIDLLSAMGSIVDSHVEHYRSDFDLDRRILTEAAGRGEHAGRTYLWLCRTMGTWLLSECNVFIRSTREYNTFNYYAGQASGDVIAYAVEVAGTVGNTVTGNLYTLDYLMHHKHVVSAAVKAGSILFVYENGQRVKPAGTYINGQDDADYGKFRYFEFQPEDTDALRWILSGEQAKRKAFQKGDFARYVAEMYTRNT